MRAKLCNHPCRQEQLIDNARAQSEPLLGAQVRPCRDPTKDHLLAALNLLEVSRPHCFTLLLDGLLLTSGLLFAATLALNAATTWVSVIGARHSLSVSQGALA